MAALENVREHIERIAVEGQLEREVGDTPVRLQLNVLRNEARVEAAQAELAALKQDLGSNLISEKSKEEAIPLPQPKIERVPA